ncbi:MAG TPA: MarR family winged helix-turn-helix transcriptional regulator [Magnetospirillaceae bacterium]|nr:MarR family winged helix-turn-helix transcriptional regulator [Magnetospirillaceae bacterium]
MAMDLLDLEHFLPYRLSVLANRVSRGFGRLYEERFDLKLPEWRVMAVLGRQPGITAREVVELTAMDKVAISRAVARLIEMGRVSAETDSADGRRQRLSLSEAGLDIYRQIIPLARRIENALVAGIEASDLAVLDKLLAHLTEAAETIDHD